MSDGAAAGPLIQELHRLLPNMAISVASERPWHGQTAAGTLFCVSAVFDGKNHRQEAAAITGKLPKHEFGFENPFVADIAVIAIAAGDTRTCLTIAALLLDD